MGSGLCFPTLALVVWALLTVGAPDADTREGILVYGDDVIVPSGYAANAMRILELFGLRVNRDKSFTSGLFRESCGVDAFNGHDVTPVKLHTVWSSNRSPEVLASFASYANELHHRKYYYTYELIAGWLLETYSVRINLKRGKRVFTRFVTIMEAPYGSKQSCPFLVEVPDKYRPDTRTSHRYQRREVYTWVVRPRKVYAEIDGWRMLFRYFTDTHSGQLLIDQFGVLRPHADTSPLLHDKSDGRRIGTWESEALYDPHFRYSVCSYTRPRATKLSRAWVAPRK